MAREHLSERLKDAGQELLAQTDALGMQAQGAMWLYDHRLQDWRYILVTSLVDTIGRRKTYKLLIEAFERLHLPSDIVIDDVYLASPSDEFFQLVSRVFHISGTSMGIFDNCTINNVRLDGVIYRSVLDVPSKTEADRIEKRFAKRVKDLAA
jgi:hypothetical protein